ncbi:MAG: MFS transporter [Bacteroidetes bacterium 43-93]|nr:MFS transporter [Bacteroidota bacterium]OJW96721.1 MAG: MFS transporter [Bacteroidetes bacterium 43-93]
MHENKSLSIVSIPVIVAALGYFVDIYDLLLFSIVRVKSLKSLGLTDELISSDGMRIISVQMWGLLIGGIIWGMLGDKKGRLSVLFGSILLYSIANIANGFVVNVDQYAICRFIAGIGLAGELGAGITLVSELISKEKRGMATSVVAGVGLMGAVLAYFISQSFDWRICYYIGGGLGLVLLALRISVYESGMFKNIQHAEVSKGNFLMFFTNGQRFKKYLLAILIGLPTWYVIGILVTFSKEFGKAFGIAEDINPGKAVMLSYVAISIADLAIGFLSQALKSRKKALYIFYAITIVGIVLYFRQDGGSATRMYAICALVGFGTGFWAIFVTMAAEHFGTNLRATAATTVPNMVRGSLPIMVWGFKILQPGYGYINAGIITGVIVMIISSIAAVMTEETFGKDLNFLEH